METDPQNPNPIIPPNSPPHQNTSVFESERNVTLGANPKEMPRSLGYGGGGLSKGFMPSRGAMVALVISNLMPIFGVLFFDWNISSILILYWLENVVIGFYALLKISTAQGIPQQPIISNISGKTKKLYSKKAYFFFFIFIYGIFTAVHGGMVITFFGQEGLSLWEIGSALLGLFISHGISYRNNFIQRGEYLTASPDRQMLAPFKRVMVMHATGLIGGFLAVAANTVNLIAGGQIINAVLPALVILVFIKIIVDLTSHLYEHNALPAGIIFFSAKGGVFKGGMAIKGWKR